MMATGPDAGGDARTVILSEISVFGIIPDKEFVGQGFRRNDVG